MLYRIAADATLIVHLTFILFVVLGAVLAARWRWMPLLHLPAAAWAVYAELAGALCPLTVLENRLLVLAGRSGYGGSFVEHYLLPVIYSAGLTREIQQWLAVTVVVLNVLIYAWLVHSRTRRGEAEA
jgi:Protein of Unknown function (DUF2784)